MGDQECNEILLERPEYEVDYEKEEYERHARHSGNYHKVVASAMSDSICLKPAGEDVSQNYARNIRESTRCRLMLTRSLWGALNVKLENFKQTLEQPDCDPNSEDTKKQIEKIQHDAQHLFHLISTGKKNVRKALSYVSPR